jgi:hypothetical protein
MHKSFIQIKHQGLPPDIVIALGSNQPFSLLALCIQATWVRCLMILALRDLGHSLTVRWTAWCRLALRYLANQRVKSCGRSICRFLVRFILTLSSGILVRVLILKVRLGLPSAVSATVRSPLIGLAPRLLYNLRLRIRLLSSPRGAFALLARGAHRLLCLTLLPAVGALSRIAGLILRHCLLLLHHPLLG